MSTTPEDDIERLRRDENLDGLLRALSRAGRWIEGFDLARSLGELRFSRRGSPASTLVVVIDLSGPLRMCAPFELDVPWSEAHDAALLTTTQQHLAALSPGESVPESIYDVIQAIIETVGARNEDALTARLEPATQALEATLAAIDAPVLSCRDAFSAALDALDGADERTLADALRAELARQESRARQERAALVRAHRDLRAIFEDVDRLSDIRTHAYQIAREASDLRSVRRIPRLVRQLENALSELEDCLPETPQALPQPTVESELDFWQCLHDIETALNAMEAFQENDVDLIRERGEALVLAASEVVDAVESTDSHLAYDIYKQLALSADELPGAWSALEDDILSAVGETQRVSPLEALLERVYVATEETLYAVREHMGEDAAYGAAERELNAWLEVRAAAILEGQSS